MTIRNNVSRKKSISLNSMDRLDILRIQGNLASMEYIYFGSENESRNTSKFYYRNNYYYIIYISLMYQLL